MDYFRAVMHIDDRNINKIASCFKLKEIKKNTILLSEGAICKEMYFVQKGCIRTYYLSEQGHEKTRFIAFENSIVTSISSFIAQIPSGEFVDAIEDTRLHVINYNDFYDLVAEFPEWAKFYKSLLEQAYLYQNKKIESLVTLSARQRYEQVLSETPMYSQRLSNRILASYLDISQETLSRLKAK